MSGANRAPSGVSGAGPRVLLAGLAGPGIGLGHLSRLVVAAQALQAQGCTVQLLLQAPLIARPDLQRLPHRFTDPAQPLLPAIDQALQQHRSQVLLLDLPARHVPPDLGAALARWRADGRRLVAVDGLLAHRAALDLVFIPSPRFQPPADLPAHGAPIYHGWDCLLLAPPEAPPAAWTPTEPPQVLALTGGSDATGLGQHWPTLLAHHLPAGCGLHWVTGPYAAPPQWPLHPPIPMQQHLAPAGLGPLMDRCQFAVSIFGVSVYELLLRGVPTVVFSPYGRQDDADLAMLQAEGVALVARDETEATHALAALMADPARASALSHAARTRLGQPGAATLAGLIRSLDTARPDTPPCAHARP